MAKLASQFIPYGSTGSFSRIITDYLAGNPALRPFYSYEPSLEGIQQAIDARMNAPVDRRHLVNLLEEQYKQLPDPLSAVQANIQSLLDEHSFTITTAHQPNIFTGHLYVFYKILHAISLAKKLNESLPGNRFIPVYYMGSEDADLEELGHFTVFGKSYTWRTSQTGAVGRMSVDRDFQRLIDEFAAQTGNEPFAAEVLASLRSAYQQGRTIESSTFQLLHDLFGKYGLVIFLPDNMEAKRPFISIMEKELRAEFSAPAVKETIDLFPEEYKVQAGGRDINLFYLEDNSRERIVLEQGKYRLGANLYSLDETIDILHAHPERFSPNVILRPVFQVDVLPDVAFIGGGGELAYWLELKKVFEAVNVPFPVLVLRNSFMLLEGKFARLLDKLGISNEEVFKPALDIINRLVTDRSNVRLTVSEEKDALMELYKSIAGIAAETDQTLEPHVLRLAGNALSKLEALEKKILRAARRKEHDMTNQVYAIKDALFPANSLQERVENGLGFLARYGSGFLDDLLEISNGLEQEFGILRLQPQKVITNGQDISA